MREMKDSEIEWIGLMPNEWSMQRLRFLCNIETGNMDTQHNNPKGKYPFYVRSPVVEHSDDYTFDNEAVLMAGDGVGAGKVFHYVNGKYGCHQRVYSLNNFCGINAKFIYYYLLENFYRKIEESNAKSTVDSVRLPMIKDFPVIFPHKNEQTCIVNYLDSKCTKIDAIIEREQDVIEKLKEYKMSVITEAVTKGLNPDVEMKDSGVEWIGDIPIHWKSPKIKYFAKIGSGGTPDRNKVEYWNGSVSWFKTGELQNNELFDAEEKITSLALENSSAQLFSVNTILMAMYGQGKTRGMTALLKKEAATNQACAGITIYNSNVTVAFLWQFLIGSYNAIREKAVGSGQPNLSASLISDFVIALPPKEEQIAICEYIKGKIPKIDAAILLKQSIIDKLTEYKKSLIHEVVTGKMEV